MPMASPQSTEANAQRPIHIILLVDDDRFFREAISEILGSHGYTVHTAQDGLEAITRLRELEVDCLILDVVLPRLDGGQVCNALRHDPRLRDLPVIVFSALSRKDFALFPDLRADAYVAKGPLAAAAQHLLAALQRFSVAEPASGDGLLLGYEALEPRRLVHELLGERRQLRAIFESLLPGAVELDLAGRIVRANPGAAALLGALQVGEPFAALLPAPAQAELEARLAEIARAPAPTASRTTLRAGATRLAARLLPILVDRTCTGVLVLLEGETKTA